MRGPCTRSGMRAGAAETYDSYDSVRRRRLCCDRARRDETSGSTSKILTATFTGPAWSRSGPWACRARCSRWRQRHAGCGEGASETAREARCAHDAADSPEDLLEASGLLALLDVLRVLEVAAALDLRERPRVTHARERKPQRCRGARSRQRTSRARAPRAAGAVGRRQPAREIGFPATRRGRARRPDASGRGRRRLQRFFESRPRCARGRGLERQRRGAHPARCSGQGQAARARLLTSGSTPLFNTLLRNRRRALSAGSESATVTCARAGA